jgi:hypothetical protein
MNGFIFINETFLFLLYKILLLFIIKKTIRVACKNVPGWSYVYCYGKDKVLISNNQKFEGSKIIRADFF